jgi:hypothetical protein
VCDQETLKNEEAKAHYRAVKIQPQWVVTAGKQTILLLVLWVEIYFTPILYN